MEGTRYPIFRAIEINDIFGVFTEDEGCYDVDIPGTYKYYVRDGAAESMDISIEKDHVVINFFGVIFAKKPILKDDEDYRVISGEEWGFVEGIDEVREIEKYIFERM